MSSSEAQKSPVHHATEDSTAEPTNETRQPAVVAGNAAGNPGAGARAGTDRDRIAEEAARLKARPDTAMGVPGNFERGAALADVRPDTDADANADANANANPPGVPVIGGGPGAGDASSGGGAGAGIPGGGTDIRTNGAFSGGNPDEDRKKLFPDQAAPRARQGSGASASGGETSIGKDPDESSYGGPLKIDDPTAG
jgi:hypothetical protein